MNRSKLGWLPSVALIAFVSFGLTGCKTSSWAQLPGMGWLSSDEQPEASYYTENSRPANDYASQQVDYSERYNANTAQPTNQYYGGQQFDSTGNDNNNYLGQSPGLATQNGYAQQQQVTQQPQQFANQNQYGAQQLQPSQATQFQPQQQVGQSGVGQAGSGQFQNGQGSYDRGFYGNQQQVAQQAQPKEYNFQPTNTTAQGQYNTGEFQAQGTFQPAQGGAAAYTAQNPQPGAGTQYGGTFQPTTQTQQAPMEPYRPGSTSGVSGTTGGNYYAPSTGGQFTTP